MNRSLTLDQMAQVRAAAATLLPSVRGEFVQGVKRHLGYQPTDAAVQHAIDLELSLNRLPAFLCDGEQSDEK